MEDNQESGVNKERRDEDSMRGRIRDIQQNQELGNKAVIAQINLSMIAIQEVHNRVHGIDTRLQRVETNMQQVITDSHQDTKETHRNMLKAGWGVIGAALVVAVHWLSKKMGWR
jgi:hypothetical protein